MFPNQSKFTTQQNQTSQPNPTQNPPWHASPPPDHRATGFISHLIPNHPPKILCQTNEFPYENVTLNKNTLPFLSPKKNVMFVDTSHININLTVSPCFAKTAKHLPQLSSRLSDAQGFTASSCASSPTRSWLRYHSEMTSLGLQNESQIYRQGIHTWEGKKNGKNL